MPDTGAPWNIPYVAGTDLVSDWPTDSLALANAIDAGLDAANVGIGSNVVSTTLTTTVSESIATNSYGADRLSTTITPTSSSSSVLVLVQLTASSGVIASGTWVRLMRGATPIAVGDAASSRPQNTTTQAGTTDANNAASISITFVDSPGVDTATTYSIQIYNPSAGTATFYINRTVNDTDSRVGGRYASTMTLIEVAA